MREDRPRRSPPSFEGLWDSVHCRDGTWSGNRGPLRYDAVLLDIDGTLVDSNGAHAAAWSDAFAAHGRHHPPDQIRPLIGKGSDKLLRELTSLDDQSGEGKRISEERAEIFATRYLPTLKPTPGAEQFVKWLIESP